MQMHEFHKLDDIVAIFDLKCNDYLKNNNQI